MPETHVLLTFALASLLLVLLPGPSLLFVVGRSLALGRTAGVLTALGNALGLVPPIVLVALGVGAVVQESAVLFAVLKIAGGVYLVVLGVQAIRRRGGAEVAGSSRPRTRRRIVRDGFVVGISNPKTTVFFAAILPQFADPATGPVALQMLVLGAVFVVVAVGCDSTWAVAAGAARDWFGRSPRRLAGIEAGGGVMMVGLGGTLALTGTHA